MENFIDTIGSRTRDLPACSALPQPAALPRAPYGDESVIFLFWRGGGVFGIIDVCRWDLLRVPRIPF